MYYRLNIADCQAKEFEINSAFMAQHTVNHPHDAITVRYFNADYINGFGYIIKNEYTSQFVTEYIDITELPEVSPSSFQEFLPKPNEKLLLISNGKLLGDISESGISLIGGTQEQLIEWIFSQDYDLSGIDLWQDLIGQFVDKGKLVVHNGILYIVDGPHTFQSDWPPNLAISLFSTHWPDGVIGPWRQPNGAHDSYKMGMRVTHNGFIWEVNQVDANGHNVWKPGVFGWMNIGQVNQPEEPPDEPPANPCDSIALWDSTQDWDSYVTGELRKWEIGGVMKVFSCNSKQWAYIEPGQPYSGWKYEYDCPA